MKKKYDVYFDQINRVAIEVTAESEREALEKATRKWKRDYGHPPNATVEDARDDK